MRRLDPTVAGVFVGSGSLDEALGARAAELGLSADVRALGWRNDVPRTLCAAATGLSCRGRNSPWRVSELRSWKPNSPD